MDRRVAGLGFFAGLVDSSLQLVTIQTVKKASFSTILWQFLLPFSHELWILIAVLLVVNGLAFWLFNRTPGEKFSFDALFNSVYNSIGTFTGGGSLEATKRISYPVNLGFSFFIFILAASYTANLASFLVSSNTPSVGLKSIDDANARYSNTAHILHWLTQQLNCQEIEHLYQVQVTHPVD